MATNKFATLLHKNTNKLTLILIYAVLEWILIILLLLNSLFSYLIIKFADFFGLKTPCLWCSRVDHIFGKGKNFYRDLLCESHSIEISKLGYCSNHKTLSESEDMCEECSSSKNLPFFPWIQSEGEKVKENVEFGFKCSCCGVSQEREIYSPYIVIKPSWDDLDYTKKGNLIENTGKYDKSEGRLEENYENQMLSEHEEDQNCADFEEERESIKEENSNLMMKDPSFDENLAQVCVKDDASFELLPQHLEFFVGHGGYRLIPVELIDSTTEEKHRKYRAKEEEEDDGDDDKDDDVENCENRDENFAFELQNEDEIELIAENADLSVLESMEIQENQDSIVFHTKECDFVTALAEERDLDVSTGKEELFHIPVNEIEAEVSIGTEIPDLELRDEIQIQETLPTNIPINEDASNSSLAVLNNIPFEVGDNVMNNNFSNCLDLNEIEEEKTPDTPTSLDSLHHLHKKLLMLEKRESGTEESLDGSAISELEGSDGVLTIDQLKSALKAERKALHTLYSELEEERSASAIAANQTMAMINRLQEEKAAMQMEALQYQRMMEEQSEYDQEALQLLNELMVKREKEKQELERELEVYRKKVLEYEGKQKLRLIRKVSGGSVKSDSFSGSSSSGAESDGLSIDLNREAAKEENGFEKENGHQSTPIDEVLNLEESLANFEEERISILEQLKALEEKLFTLSDEEEEHFEDIKPIEHFYEENGQHWNGDLEIGEEEGNGELENGFCGKTNGKIHQAGTKLGKRLLPLFDEMSEENEGKIQNGHVNGFHSDRLECSNPENIDLDNNKRLAIEDEVDQLYERLQALEADREFIKHCMSSLKKGDKGMDLLQEILQHLRDLRNVELRVRNLGDNNLV